MAPRTARRDAGRLLALATDRLRRDPRMAGALEPVLAGLARPLHGRRLAVRTGPGRGVRLVVTRHSAVWLLGLPERPVQRLLEDTLRPGDCFLDVGASIGFFTLLAARLVGPAGRVVAFEPEPGSRAALADNLRANGAGNVTVVECAVSDAPGTAELLAGHAPTARLARPGDTAEHRRVTVATTSIDAWLATASPLRPALVKIDVEGEELRVLDGMRETLSDHRPLVIVEVHGTQAGAVAARLASHGYGSVRLEGGGPVDEAPAGTHLLASPPARGQTP